MTQLKTVAERLVGRRVHQPVELTGIHDLTLLNELLVERGLEEVAGL